jgi:hypothetical protein
VIRGLLLAPALALVVACGQAAGGPAVAKTLVTGSVVLSPATPVCRIGSSCTKPLPGLELVFSRSGKAAARVTTDERGRYRVGLRPGRYAVTAARRGQLKPSRIRVPASPRAKVNFSFDAGIR